MMNIKDKLRILHYETLPMFSIENIDNDLRIEFLKKFRKENKFKQVLIVSLLFWSSIACMISIPFIIIGIFILMPKEFLTLIPLIFLVGVCVIVSKFILTGIDRSIQHHEDMKKYRRSNEL